MGRNKIYGEGRTQVSLYLSAEELKILDEIMYRERKSRAQISHEAMLEYMKNHSEGNDTFKLDQFQDPDFKVAPTFLGTNRDKWVQFYKSSDEKDRTQLRIQAINLQKWFQMVDINENRK